MRKGTITEKAMSAKAKTTTKSVAPTAAAVPALAKSAMTRVPRQAVRDKGRMVRIDARIPFHVKEIVQHAASIQGRSQTDFMVTAIQEAAQKVIAESSVIRLCLEDQRELAAALLDDKPSPATKGPARLRRAARDHGKKVKSL